MTQEAIQPTVEDALEALSRRTKSSALLNIVTKKWAGSHDDCLAQHLWSEVVDASRNDPRHHAAMLDNFAAVADGELEQLVRDSFSGVSTLNLLKREGISIRSLKEAFFPFRKPVAVMSPEAYQALAIEDAEALLESCRVVTDYKPNRWTGENGQLQVPLYAQADRWGEASFLVVNPDYLAAPYEDLLIFEEGNFVLQMASDNQMRDVLGFWGDCEIKDGAFHLTMRAKLSNSEPGHPFTLLRFHRVVRE